jgi:hypothetical protein
MARFAGRIPGALKACEVIEDLVSSERVWHGGSLHVPPARAGSRFADLSS